MNNKGQVWMIILFIGFLFIIVAFATIEPIKETLDTVRSGDNLNCIGASDFNQTSFDEQEDLEKLTKRPTCFVTGMSMFWFIVSFVIAVAVWIVTQIRRIKRK